MASSTEANTTVPFVMVRWNDAWKDATSDSTFEDADDAAQPILCYTVGWLLRDNPKGLLLANEYSPDGTYRGKTFVPRGMLLDVSIISLTRKRARPNGNIPAAPAAV